MTDKKQKKGVKIFCDITKCLGCKACELACAVEHSKAKELALSIKEKPTPKKRRKVSGVEDKIMSFGCQHCEEAPCVAACMSSAMYKDPITGETKHDKDKCVGCWMCIMVCPFSAIIQDVTDKVAMKCDLCPDNEDYACVAACPTNALFSGTPEEFKRRVEEKSSPAALKRTKIKSGV